MCKPNLVNRRTVLHRTSNLRTAEWSATTAIFSLLSHWSWAILPGQACPGWQRQWQLQGLWDNGEDTSLLSVALFCTAHLGSISAEDEIETLKRWVFLRKHSSSWPQFLSMGPWKQVQQALHFPASSDGNDAGLKATSNSLSVTQFWILVLLGTSLSRMILPPSLLMRKEAEAPSHHQVMSETIGPADSEQNPHGMELSGTEHNSWIMQHITLRTEFCSHHSHPSFPASSLQVLNIDKKHSGLGSTL